MKDSDFAAAVDAAAASRFPLLTRLAFKHTFECFIDLSSFNQLLPVTSPSVPASRTAAGRGEGGGWRWQTACMGDPLRLRVCAQ